MIEFPRGQIPRPDVAQERHDALDDANQQRQTPSFEGTLLSSGPPLTPIAKVLLGRVGAPYLGFVRLVIMGLDVLERVLGVGRQLPAAAASIAVAVAMAIAEDGDWSVPVVVADDGTAVVVMVALVVVVGIAAQAKVVGVSRVGLADAVVMMMAVPVPTTAMTPTAVAIAAEIGPAGRGRAIVNIAVAAGVRAASAAAAAAAVGGRSINVHCYITAVGYISSPARLACYVGWTTKKARTVVLLLTICRCGGAY